MTWLKMMIFFQSWSLVQQVLTIIITVTICKSQMIKYFLFFEICLPNTTRLIVIVILLNLKCVNAI